MLRLIAARRARDIDRVWLATAIVLGVTALAWPAQAVASLQFTLGSLWFVAPFLAISAALAAAIAASGLDRQIARVLMGRPATVIFAAAVFGALSPLCSVSVIPVVAGLLAAGVPLAPVMAFWIGSPLMDPEMFILTAAIIDLPFALTRALSALAMGLAAGYATQALARYPTITSPLRPDAARSGFSSVWGSCDAYTPGETPAVAWAFWREPGRRQAFAGQTLAIAAFLVKWLTLAFVIESLLVALIPAERVAASLGGGEWWVIPVSVLVGVPTYLNAYAATPTVSALLDMGMQPGAALAFMTAGEVTSLPTAMSVFVLVRRGVFAWYLALGLTGALAVGAAYQLWATL